MQKELVVELLPSAVRRETGSRLLVNALCLIQQALQQWLQSSQLSLAHFFLQVLKQEQNGSVPFHFHSATEPHT